MPNDPKPKTRTASAVLEGQTEEQFNTIKDHMNKTLPGLNPDNAAVVRFALHTTAERIREVTK